MTLSKAVQDKLPIRSTYMVHNHQSELFNTIQEESCHRAQHFICFHCLAVFVSQRFPSCLLTTAVKLLYSAVERAILCNNECLVDKELQPTLKHSIINLFSTVGVEKNKRSLVFDSAILISQPNVLFECLMHQCV